MPKTESKVTFAAHLILRYESYILVMRRHNTPEYNYWYALPMGSVEKYEVNCPILALAREVENELSIGINPAYTRFVHAMFRPNHNEAGDRVDFFFESHQWEGTIINKEPEKYSHIAWCDAAQFPLNVVHHVKEALEQIKKGRTYSAFGPEHFSNLKY